MKHRILMLFLFSSVLLCVVLSFPVSFFSAQRFVEAQRQWQNNNMQDYEAVIQVMLPLIGLYEYRSVVHDGQVVEIGRRGGLRMPGIDSTSDYAPESFEPIPLEEASHYTIDGLMSFARDAVGDAPPIEIRSCGGPYWDAEYDSEYGYIRSLRMSCGGGFLGCTISDCSGGYTLLNFTPLP
jgi:hypothetical protein